MGLSNVVIISCCVLYAAANDFVNVPIMSPAVVRGIDDPLMARFFDVWRIANEHDGGSSMPGLRFNNEPNTIFIPDFNFVVPHDVEDPLVRVGGESSAELRRNFLINHLGLDSADPTDTRIATEEGLLVEMLNGNLLYVKKDIDGKVYVEANGKKTPVRQVVELDQGIFVYLLDGVLFDSEIAVRDAISPNLRRELEAPLGPPLDIPDLRLFNEPQPIKLEDGTWAFPPALPPLDVLFKMENRETGMPPAPPPREAVMPPAPPKAFQQDADVPIGPPAPAPSFVPRDEIKSFAPKHQELNRITPLQNGVINENSFYNPANRGKTALEAIDQFAAMFELTQSKENSIVKVLQENGHPTFLTLLETTGVLQKVLSGVGGPFVFVTPTEDAFSKLPPSELEVNARDDLIKYHVIPLRGQSPDDVVHENATFNTLLGQYIRYNDYNNSLFANGIPVLNTISYPGGKIQIIDGVLSPPVGDIRDALLYSGFPLTRMVTLATVSKTLADRHPLDSVTIFAPLDSSINSKGYCWRCILLGPDHGDNIIKGHLLQGAWYSEGLLKEGTLTTSNGTTVTFRRNSNDIITVNGIPIIKSDLSATNGIVHIVADMIPTTDIGIDQTSNIDSLFGYVNKPGEEETNLKNDDEVIQKNLFNHQFNRQSIGGNTQRVERKQVYYEDNVRQLLNNFNNGFQNGINSPYNTFKFNSPLGNNRDLYNDYNEFVPIIDSTNSSPHLSEIMIKLNLRNPQHYQQDYNNQFDNFNRDQEPFESLNPFSNVQFTPGQSFQNVDENASPRIEETAPQPLHYFDDAGANVLNTLKNVDFTNFEGDLRHGYPTPQNQNTELGITSNPFEQSIDQNSNLEDNFNLPVGNTIISPENNNLILHPSNVFLEFVSPQGLENPKINISSLYSPPNHLSSGIPEFQIETNHPLPPKQDEIENNTLTSYSLVNNQYTNELPFNELEENFNETISTTTDLTPDMAANTLGNSEETRFNHHLPMKTNTQHDILPLKETSRKGNKIDSTDIRPEEELQRNFNNDTFDRELCIPPKVTRQSYSKQGYGQNIVNILDQLNLTEFASLLNSTGLTDTLNAPQGLWTIFAPTNDALKEVSSSFLLNIAEKRDVLRRLVSYHILPGSFNTLQANNKLPTLAYGHILSVDCLNDGLDTTWLVGGAIVDELTINDETSNAFIHDGGIIYPIDRVIYAPHQDVINTIRQSPLLTNFTRIIDNNQDLYDYLKGKSDFTIFIPSNAAFEDERKSPDLDWLKSHIVPSILHKEELKKHQSITTDNNTNLSINTRNNDQVMVNGKTIQYSDVNTSKGVIHVVDQHII